MWFEASDGEAYGLQWWPAWSGAGRYEKSKRSVNRAGRVFLGFRLLRFFSERDDVQSRSGYQARIDTIRRRGAGSGEGERERVGVFERAEGGRRAARGRLVVLPPPWAR